MATLLPFPRRRAEPLDLDLTEVAAAISLVARGAAREVRLVNLRRPLAVAGAAAAEAGEAGVDFRVERSTGRVALVICRRGQG